MVQPDNRQAVAKSPRGGDIPRDFAGEPRPKARARAVDTALFAGLAVAVHHQVTARTGLFVEAIFVMSRPSARERSVSGALAPAFGDYRGTPLTDPSP